MYSLILSYPKFWSFIEPVVSLCPYLNTIKQHGYKLIISTKKSIISYRTIFWHGVSFDALKNPKSLGVPLPLGKSISARVTPESRFLYTIIDLFVGSS